MVSVIVPFHNAGQWIERCARSLFSQTAADECEFIFVDDASTDSSPDLLSDLIRRERPDAILIRNPRNLGVAEARFVGIDAARGEYVLSIDADDRPEPDMVEALLARARLTDADLVCCEADIEVADHTEPRTFRYDRDMRRHLADPANFTEVHVAFWNKLIRRSLIVDNGIRPFPGVDYGEDSAVTFRLRYLSRRTEIVHRTLYHYNQRNAASMMQRLSEKAALQRVELAARLDEFVQEQKRKQEAEVDLTLAVNWYKFQSKEYWLRVAGNPLRHPRRWLRALRRWASIYPESHRDIRRFPLLSPAGRLKWRLAALLGAAVKKPVTLNPNQANQNPQDDAN